MYLIIDMSGRPTVTAVFADLCAACDECDKANQRKGAASVVARLPELLENQIAEQQWDKLYGDVEEGIDA